MSGLFTFFYLYDPWLFHFLRMSFAVGALAILFLGYKWFTRKITSFYLPTDSLLICIALIALSVIPILINGTQELGVIVMYVKLLIIFLLGCVIYNLFYHHLHGKEQFIQDLNIGISIQSSIGFLALLGLPVLVGVALSTNSEMGGQLSRFIGSEQEYRLYNLTSSAFFPLSAFYLMLLHFLLAYNEKINKINSIYILLILIIGLISGRTFLLMSIFSLFLYFKLRYIPVLVLFAATLLYLAYSYPEQPYIKHALEPLINLLYSADSLSSSTDTLVEKHLFMPEFKQFLMGDGKYYVVGRTAKSYYGGSDSGFIRQVLYGGIGYLLICFLFTAYFVKRIADNWFGGSWKYILSTLIILSILNIKADTYAYPGIMFVFLMFVSLFGEKGKILLLERK